MNVGILIATKKVLPDQQEAPFLFYADGQQIFIPEKNLESAVLSAILQIVVFDLGIALARGLVEVQLAKAIAKR